MRFKEATYVATIYNATVVFDRPLEKSGPHGPFYSMCIALPDGAPGAEYNEKYQRNQAYISFDEGRDEAPYLLSLTRGDELQVLYDTRRKRYYAVVPDGASTTGSPAADPVSGPAVGGVGNAAQLSQTVPVGSTAQSPPASGGRSQFLKPLEVEGFTLLAEQSAGIILRLLETIAPEGQRLDLNKDEQLRVAITSFIEANRHWERARTEAVQKAIEAKVYAIDPEALPDSLLELVAEYVPYYGDNPANVGKALKELGLSRDELDPDNPDTWLQVFHIARLHAEQKERQGPAQTDENNLPF